MALMVSTTKEICSEMMDTKKGGKVGTLSDIDDVMGKFKYRQNGLCPGEEEGQEINGDDQTGSFPCRHCQSNFSTLVKLQQHIVCDHTRELRSELNHYQHKKHRILEEVGRGSVLHHKKRKLLEAAINDNDDVRSNGCHDNIQETPTPSQDHMSHNNPSSNVNFDKIANGSITNGKLTHDPIDLSTNIASLKSENGYQYSQNNQFLKFRKKSEFLENQESEENGDFDGEDRLVIDTNGSGHRQYSQSENGSRESGEISNAFTSYPHKKLKRKDYFDYKAGDDSKNSRMNLVTENSYHCEELESPVKSNQWNGRMAELNRDSDFPTTKSVESHSNLDMPYQVNSNFRNEMDQTRNGEITGAHDLMKPNFTQPTVMPGFPSINMNMYGHFAMPLNFPHPMMYMNPAMFMPPMTNGLTPNDKLLSQASSQMNLPVPPTMPPQVNSPGNLSEEAKPKRASAGQKRPRATERSRAISDDVKNSVLEIYECKVCSRKFSQVGNFHNHMKLHNEKVCMCGICKLEFSDSYELQRHMRNAHTGSMPYKCNECDREFSQYNNLRRHLRVHNGKTYKCHICGRTFNEVFYLEMHIGSHTGERTYKCGVCSLAFRDNADLQKHVKTHSAEELHTCEVCGKSFSKACVLRQHKKMHLGIRPYKCDVCSKAFIHRHHLTIHMRMHNTSKPYRCKICHKDFSQTSHLYKHIKQHSEELGRGDDIIGKNGQSSYPSAAEIEEMFQRIRSPSDVSSKSIESNMSSLSDSTPSEEGKVSQTSGASDDIKKNGEHDKSVELLINHSVDESASQNSSQNEIPPYSPISTVSSQGDSQSVSDSMTPTIDSESCHDNDSQPLTVTEHHPSPGDSTSATNGHWEGNKNHLDRDLELQTQGHSESCEKVKMMNQAQSSADSVQHKDNVSQNSPVPLNLPTESPCTNDNASKGRLPYSDSLNDHSTCNSIESVINEKDVECKQNSETCDISLMQDRRVSDTDGTIRDSSSAASKTELLGKSSASPCPSIGSISDISQAESATASTSSPHPSTGSMSDGEKVAKRQTGKKRGPSNGTVRRRRKKNVELKNGPNPHQTDGQLPLLNGQMPFMPQVMPNITTEMQKLYMLQMQQLQGLHMALFTNAMATQNAMATHNNKHEDAYSEAKDVALKERLHEISADFSALRSNGQRKTPDPGGHDPNRFDPMNRHLIKREVIEAGFGPVDLSVPKGGNLSTN